MNGPPLSSQERRILEEIEADLRTDRDLDSALSGMRMTLLRRARCAAQSWGRDPVVLRLLLILGSVGLLCLAIVVRASVILVPAVVLWVVGVSVLLRRNARRRGNPGR